MPRLVKLRLSYYVLDMVDLKMKTFSPAKGQQPGKVRTSPLEEMVGTCLTI